MLTLDAEDRVVAKLGDFGLHAVLKEPKHVYDASTTIDQDHAETLSSGSTLSRVKTRLCL